MQIAGCVVNGSVAPADIIVSEISIGMTAGDQNPVNKVHFYDYADSTTKRTLKQSQVSHLLPNIFQACHMRLCKQDFHPCFATC